MYKVYDRYIAYYISAMYGMYVCMLWGKVCMTASRKLPLPPLPRECSFQKWRAPMLADLRTTIEHYNSLIHTYILICSTYRVHRIYEVFRDASERILSLWLSRHFLKRFNRIANFTYSHIYIKNSDTYYILYTCMQ